MKKKTLTLINRLLALIIVALGVCSCKARQKHQQTVQELEPVEIEDVRTVRCMYGVRPVPFDTVMRDTTTTQPKDTIRRVPRRPNPGAIRALYGVFPTEFHPAEEE